MRTTISKHELNVLKRCAKFWKRCNMKKYVGKANELHYKNTLLGNLVIEIKHDKLLIECDDVDVMKRCAELGLVELSREEE